MSTETPVAATPPTPENVAEMLTEGDSDYHDGNNWKPSISRRGNVVHIKITPYSEPDEDDLDDEAVELDDVHYRAVVVPGEKVPIMLPRPDLADALAFEGDPYDGDPNKDGWLVCAATAGGRSTLVAFADSILFRGAPGHITTTEARRFAAALVAVADAVDAAQAEQDGGQADG